MGMYNQCMVNKETTQTEAEMESDREWEAEVKRVEDRVLAKAEGKVRRAAVGEEFTIRKNANTTVTGTIEKVEVAGVRWGGRTCNALFAVTLVCGEAEIRRTYNVQRFPSTR